VLLLRLNSYADAQSWDDLVYAFIETLKNSPLDEIVFLLHNTLPGPHVWRSKYVRLVFYNRLDEVPGLLLSMTPSALMTVTTPAHPQRLDGDHDEQGQEIYIDIPRERIADRAEVEVVIPGSDHEQETNGTRVDAARTIQDAYRRHLERKWAGAARRIQAAYRRYLKRKNFVRKEMEAAQAHYWRLLRKRSMKMQWSKGSRYYLLFRVPLAYILVCLDVVTAFAVSKRRESKKRLMTEDYRGLEELVDALVQYRYDDADYTLSRWPKKSQQTPRKNDRASEQALPVISIPRGKICKRPPTCGSGGEGCGGEPGQHPRIDRDEEQDQEALGSRMEVDSRETDECNKRGEGPETKACILDRVYLLYL